MDIKRFKEVKIKMIMKLRGVSREEAARIEESTSGDVESDDDTGRICTHVSRARPHPHIPERMVTAAEFIGEL